MPRQSRSADEGPGRRFKRRKRKRGKRGAVSQRRGRDKSAEGKDRQFRDRSERPGDRSKSKRSRKRRPVRRQRREGGDREKRDFKPQTGRPGDDRGRSQGRQRLGGIRDEINAIKQRREQFSQQRPEQVAEGRGFDPSRLQDFREGGRFSQPAQPQPSPAQPVIGPDGRVAPQEAPPIRQEVPPQQGGDFTNGAGIVPGQGGDFAQNPAQATAPVNYGVDQVGGSPDQAGPAAGGFTPVDHPGPTAPPGVATDAYGKPANPGSGPYAPQIPPQPQFPAPQMNPRAAGMDRFSQQPPQIGQPQRPEERPRY